MESQDDFAVWEWDSLSAFVAREVVVNGGDDALDVVFGARLSQDFEDAALFAKVEGFKDSRIAGHSDKLALDRNR